ncbi:hypothetical protein [Silvanigrella aquatica]|uniref:Uncharacterized protein n=1 Tax=Silvanigrella aquatica TaxID=1915309 RepID=A0A1L4D144_9BACT|nr:hypothetical protein [Silvanigrella aquatica]APJ03932.1 hypothetical protein AXG55_08450 [Silvanigrella aquatica]
MPHRRDEIKNIIHSLLFKKTIAGENIFTPYIPAQDIEMNNKLAVGIHCLKETVEQTYGNINYKRKAEFKISIISPHIQNAENQTDVLTKQIETEIANFKTKEFEFTYVGMEAQEFHEQKTLNHIITSLLFFVTYETYENTNNELDDLLITHIEVQNGII